MDDAMRKGKEIPDRIANPPELPEGTEFFLEAFFDLNFDRSIGFGEGPIPTTAILSYSRHYGLEEDEEESLVFFVRQLDEEYLAYSRKSNESKAKKK